MNKPELITRIAKDNNCSKSEAKRVIEFFTNTVGQALVNGEDVNLSGFGNFKIIECAAKKYRHPATGQMEEMPPTTKVKFTPAIRIAEAIK